MGEYAEMYDDCVGCHYWDDSRYDPEKPRVLVLVGDFMATIYFSFYPGKAMITRIKAVKGVYDTKMKSWMIAKDRLKLVRQDLIAWGDDGTRFRKASSDVELPTKEELDWLNEYARDPRLIAPSEVGG